MGSTTEAYWGAREGGLSSRHATRCCRLDPKGHGALLACLSCLSGQGGGSSDQQNVSTACGRGAGRALLSHGCMAKHAQVNANSACRRSPYGLCWACGLSPPSHQGDICEGKPPTVQGLSRWRGRHVLGRGGGSPPRSRAASASSAGADGLGGRTRRCTSPSKLQKEKNEL